MFSLVSILYQYPFPIMCGVWQADKKIYIVRILTAVLTMLYASAQMVCYYPGNMVFAAVLQALIHLFRLVL